MSDEENVSQLLNKVNYNGDVLKIEWEQFVSGSDKPDAYAGVFHDRPRREFVAALEVLAVHTPGLIGIEDPNWHEGLEVRGAAFKWKQGEVGAKLICVKELENGLKFSFNTPFMRAGETEQSLPTEVVEALESLMDEAWTYLDGDRAQLTLIERNDEDGESNGEGDTGEDSESGTDDGDLGGEAAEA